MTLEQVITKGKAFNELPFSMFNYWDLWLIVSVTVIIVLIMFAMIKWKKKEKVDIVVYTTLVVTVFGLGVLISNVTVKMDYDKQKEQWITQTVEPYIESLPESRFKVRDIHHDKGWEGMVDVEEQEQWITSSYSREGKYAKVTYIDDENYIKDLEYYYEIRATDESKPYLEYRKLSNVLGHGIKKGNYNITLVIPDDYDLN